MPETESNGYNYLWATAASIIVDLLKVTRVKTIDRAAIRARWDAHFPGQQRQVVIAASRRLRRDRTARLSVDKRRAATEGVVARKHLSKALKKLEGWGAIARNGNHVRVIDVAGLVKATEESYQGPDQSPCLGTEPTGDESHRRRATLLATGDAAHPDSKEDRR